MQVLARFKAPLALTVCAMAISTAAQAQSVAQPKPADAQANADSQEIVVTASKREERLQDAPISINAVKGDRLADLGIANFSDLTTLVPNLNVAGAAASGVGTIIIRGVYAGNFSTNATTATYIGETPFTANSALSLSGLVLADPDLLDVERIEVLKGPQGTLYGATSLAGLVRILPKEPDLTKFSGMIRVDGQAVDGGDVGGGIRAGLNIPLSSWAALRISGLVKYDPGFITNLGTGHHNLGNTKTEGGSAALLLKPSADLDIVINGQYEHLKTRGLLEQDDLPGTGTPRYGERTYSFPNDGGSRSTYWLVDATLRYKTDLGTLTGTVSHAHYATDESEDATYTYGVIVPTLPAPLPSFFPAGFNVLTDAAPLANKTTVELRFASKRLGSAEFIAGAFYTDEKTQYPVSIRDYSSPGVPFNYLAPLDFLNYIANLNSLDHYKEYAGFGDLTYYLTDKFDLTGGLRYSHNEQVVYEVIQTGLLPLGPDTVSTFNDNSVVFQASARWRPSPDTSFYARVASGYRPGGAQVLTGGAPGIPTSYKADRTITYEGGVKGKAFDRHLLYDLAVYHTDWTDVHLTGVAGGVGYTLNGGNATINGFEAQIDWTDPSGWKFGSAVGYADSKLKHPDPNVTASIGAVDGDRLPGSPRWTASAYVDYRHSLDGDLTGSLGATLAYQGDKVSSYPGAVNDVNYNIPGYALLNLRAGLDLRNYNLEVILDNVANKNGITGYYVNGIIPAAFNPLQPGNAYLTRPRNVKVSFTAKF